MSYLSDITASASELGRLECASVAASCAESMRPVVARFAHPISLRAFEEGLDVSWKTVRDGVIDSRAVSVRARLNNLPESTCDDSNVPAYDVMCALSILSYTLDLITNDSWKQPMISACTAAVEYYSGYDLIVTRGGKAQMINPSNPPPPGPFESLQIQMQLRVLYEARSLLQSRHPAVEEMQKCAIQVASKLEEALPSYTEGCGWNLG